MTMEDYNEYHKKKRSKRESELKKTLISVRVSTLNDKDKKNLLVSLRTMVEEEINMLTKQSIWKI
jgi:hypothetical protein